MQTRKPFPEEQPWPLGPQPGAHQPAFCAHGSAWLGRPVSVRPCSPGPSACGFLHIPDAITVHSQLLAGAASVPLAASTRLACPGHCRRTLGQLPPSGRCGEWGSGRVCPVPAESCVQGSGPSLGGEPWGSWDSHVCDFLKKPRTVLHGGCPVSPTPSQMLVISGCRKMTAVSPAAPGDLPAGLCCVLPWPHMVYSPCTSWPRMPLVWRAVPSDPVRVSRGVIRPVPVGCGSHCVHRAGQFVTGKTEEEEVSPREIKRFGKTGSGGQV